MKNIFKKSKRRNNYMGNINSVIKVIFYVGGNNYE